MTFVASEAEFTPKNVQTRDERVKLVYRVKIGLDNKDGLFKPGMPAEATVSYPDARPMTREVRPRVDARAATTPSWQRRT